MSDKVTPAASRPKRPALPSESYAKSAVILVGAFLAHYLVAWAVEDTAFLKATAKAVSTFVWSSPNVVAYVPVSVYFVVVMWHLYYRSEESKKAASKRWGPGTFVNTLLIWWNLGLASYSMLMLAGLIRGLIALFRTHGFNEWLCDGDLSWYSSPGLVLCSHLFCLSKIPELIDTAFLVLRGKEVIFLHWYHHISVLLYCWYVTQVHYPATHFAAINAFVHSIMYYYYFRRAQGIKPKFDKMVTLIQLTQMALGLAFSSLFFHAHFKNPACNGGATVARTGLLYTSFAVTGGMYLSYFVLFAIFYIHRYCRPKKEGESHED